MVNPFALKLCVTMFFIFACLFMVFRSVIKYDISPLCSYFIDIIQGGSNGMRDMVIVSSLGSVSWMGLMNSGMGWENGTVRRNRVGDAMVDGDHKN